MGFIAPNRITSRGAKRRRRIAFAVAAAVALVAALAGCGGGSSPDGTKATAAAVARPNGHGGTAQEVSTPTPSTGESADALLLDKVLARQEAAVAAFAKVIPTLSPRLSHMASYFRAQEQEHVDATIKALRGLKSAAEPQAEPLEPGELKTERERVEFLYEVEGATIDEELSAISKLEASWPRSLLASVVADQGQHRTLLRQALGAGPLASVPEAFENGTAPPPEATPTE
ncbi:MAG: ferritin-like domain-containing protein [Solirubrobacterales bacterium]